MKEKSKRTKFLSEYSYIAVYVIILIVYVITNHGLTMSGFMNIFRHSAVIGIHWIRHGTDLFDRRYRPFCRFHACACKRFFGSDI